MCGISGIIDLGSSGVSLEKLQSMNDRSVHRGPDDEGVSLFSDTGGTEQSRNTMELKRGKKYCAGFAHRRLSILDLSPRGHQPMFDHSQRYCIVFNGEIFNYKELREELISLGYAFHSDSDTEVILASYRQWGTDCQKRFNGMWSFAIYDTKERTLFCSRDRFGIKPFYFAYAKDFFVFSSEIKQIWGCISDVGINENILAEFFFWGFEGHSEKTFFRNISCLPASHYMLITFEDIRSASFQPKRYWRFERENSLSFEAAIERFRELFFDSVRLRLRSDVRVGTSLSGGLDSSSVACVMAELLGARAENLMPNMFTSVYPDPGFSEKSYADAVVEKTGFKQFCVHPVSEDLGKDWHKFIWHMEEPFGGLSYFSNWKVYEKARQENTPVILNGQGGDELLLGYERYRAVYLNLLLKKGKIGQAAAEFYNTRHRANFPFYKQLMYQLYFSLPALRLLRRRSLIKPYLKNDFYHAYKRKASLTKDELHYENIVDLQQKEFFKFQLQHLLRHEDRVSMAFSIEARLPFLDYRLFNFILSQDDSLKLNAGWSKYILRQAMNGYLPDLIRNRRDKMGFDTPIKRLFLENRDLISDIVDSGSSDEFVDVKNIKRDLKTINENLLCSLLTFLSWRKIFRA